LYGPRGPLFFAFSLTDIVLSGNIAKLEADGKEVLTVSSFEGEDEATGSNL
jgi:hypothetical protein